MRSAEDVLRRSGGRAGSGDGARRRDLESAPRVRPGGSVPVGLRCACVRMAVRTTLNEPPRQRPSRFHSAGGPAGCIPGLGKRRTLAAALVAAVNAEKASRGAGFGSCSGERRIAEAPAEGPSSLRCAARQTRASHCPPCAHSAARLAHPVTCCDDDTKSVHIPTKPLAETRLLYSYSERRRRARAGASAARLRPLTLRAPPLAGWPRRTGRRTATTPRSAPRR